MLERIFSLKENNTNPKTEIVAGITTFMTMSYIIFVQPAVLGAAGIVLEEIYNNGLLLRTSQRREALRASKGAG